MAKVEAFHTDRVEYGPNHRNVFHDQSECGYGKEIKSEHRVKGEGNRSRCDRCKDLAK
jgi:hypothetical protein